VKVAAQGGVGLWLHGHRHDPYRLVDTGLAPFPVICSGSATQTDRWSYGAYVLENHHLHGQQRVYEPQAEAFGDGESFHVDLPAARQIG